jgi:2-polyprenyl-6-methoxyphenol hydroxylase-like FAD-dependent oxidoreductase
MRIAVVGGGPGGLFAATLIKRAHPAYEVTVLERNRADDTFGFGVVFSDATLAGIHAVDPVLLTALTEHGVRWDTIEVRLHGEQHRCEGNGMAAVERKQLLRLLQAQAIDEGVDLRFTTEAQVDAVLVAGYDLVVAADGANSRLRERYADVLRPTAETAAAKFIWLGTTYPFDGLTFVHERSEHGVFAVHGYPIGNGLSTFIVETDENAWRAAGLDEFDVTQPPGVSDEKSRQYLSALFADRIEGHPLLVNNSRWGNFCTRRAGRWHHRVGGTAVVLLGDAAHTAHFSVGSGTKMAMEDAVALAEALATMANESAEDLDAALSTYETRRQPEVARIQNSARPSLSWWEHFGRAHDNMPGWQFAYHFFTRSLSDKALHKRAPGFVDASHQAWRDAHGGEPLTTPVTVSGHRLEGRRVRVAAGEIMLSEARLPLHEHTADGSGWALDVHAPEAEADLAAALDAVAKGVVAGAALVVVRGGTALTRRLLCEASRLEHRVPTVLVEDGAEARYGPDDVAVTAVLSGRTDLVASAAPGGAAGNTS